VEVVIYYWIKKNLWKLQEAFENISMTQRKPHPQQQEINLPRHKMKL